MFRSFRLNYNSDKVLKNISIILFFGSLWGIVEATLGYGLHKINFSFGWCIWFPLAFFFMDKIYKKTGKSQHMLYGAVIAAMIKLTNLFIEVRVDKVLNPSISIILEAATLFAFYKIFEENRKTIGLLEVAAINILWRGLYDIYILLMPSSYFIISPLIGIQPFLSFMLLESLVNTILITAYIVARQYLARNLIAGKKRSFNVHPIISVSMFLFAVLLQFLL